MKRAINKVFDAVELLANRLPVLHRLLVELILIALVIIGAYTLFSKHI